jgi:hypothetical protein
MNTKFIARKEINESGDDESSAVSLIAVNTGSNVNEKSNRDP